MTIKRLVYSIYSHLINLTITSINSIWVPKPIRLRSNHSLHSSYLQSHSNSLGLSNQSYLICIGLLILGSIEIIFNSSSLDPHHLPLSNAHQLKLIRNQMKYAPFDYLKQNSLLPESNSNYNVSLNSLQHRWIHPRPFSNSSGRSFVKQDVTAVLLNWNRPENVVLIVAHLCRYDFIHSIIIWNNNHDSNPLKKEDFVHTECASHKLSIINSPSNLYFVSRYLACLQSVTEYCFFQDDDTIVTSIRTMYHQFKSDPKSIVVQSDPIYSVMYGHEWCFKNQAGTLDTCFAWLGHGSFVSKAMVLRFMKTVSSLSLPADQIALSDNFFTTSFNQKPLVMVTSSIFNLPSLAIGFSDGHHGLQRNRIYIQKGVEELSKMVQKNPLEFIPRINSKEASMMKSTNFLDTYMFVCNVEVFPNLTIFWNSQRFGSLELWENRLGKVGRSLSINEAGEVGIEDGVWSEGEEWVIRFPVSAAVDGDLSTCWRSINPISKDEFIGIKLIDKVRVNEKKLKMVLTINRSKEIFQSVLLQGYFNSKWITLSFSKFDCERIEKNQLEPLMNSKGQEKEGEGEDWIESGWVGLGGGGEGRSARGRGRRWVGRDSVG
ncbi:uncharacterized protein MELLADRAFT_111799 [Melampsora larici-populina 98AG31]|uniref:Uncharacterized protein n=1 Tax=Melampsora larici-populina (strain 98AG31 / pathotype 3-4-7) TaxID=747676 RepID=F4S4E2_MELLP|nr:uncharacterized protein MELLADRAFT_111799 [Melampsora larici-populina 98AG31]EGG00485.1 hypothetical protein MELLADRAFT_111799 [Melampsora larici-populina 98AG31]